MQSPLGVPKSRSLKDFKKCFLKKKRYGLLHIDNGAFWILAVQIWSCNCDFTMEQKWKWECLQQCPWHQCMKSYKVTSATLVNTRIQNTLRATYSRFDTETLRTFQSEHRQGCATVFGRRGSTLKRKSTCGPLLLQQAPSSLHNWKGNAWHGTDPKVGISVHKSRCIPFSQLNSWQHPQSINTVLLLHKAHGVFHQFHPS